MFLFTIKTRKKFALINFLNRNKAYVIYFLIYKEILKLISYSQTSLILKYDWLTWLIKTLKFTLINVK